MKQARGLDIADLLLWHPVNTFDARQYDVHLFLRDYDSKGKYTRQIGDRAWWFELEADAVVFKLKFG